MAKNNIDKFNYISLHILNKLYDSFPTKIELSDTDFIVDIYFENEDEVQNAIPIFNDSITWLNEEGFLRMKDYSDHEGYNFYDVRLTMKGLTILGSIPSTLNKGASETLIDEIKSAIGKGIQDSAADGVKNIIKTLFTLSMISLTNSF